jgi:succinylglutamate desuccinylase
MNLAERFSQSGDFFDWCLEQTDPLATPIGFELGNRTQVKVNDLGVIMFEPLGSGNKDIVLSCAVHGNETAPIEMCDHLVKQVLTEQIQLKHSVMFVFANLPAVKIDQRFVEENMNALFSGRHSDGEGLINAERQRAAFLEQQLAIFFTQGSADSGLNKERLHYDLHTAIRESKHEKFAVYPYLHGEAHSQEQLCFLRDCGVSTILLSNSPTSTFSYFSSRQFGAHAFTVELGKVRPFGQNDMRNFADAKHMFLQLITRSQLKLAPFQPEQFHIYGVNQVVMRHQSDFRLHFADDTPNFTDYPAGTILASESGRQYVAEQDGEAIVFPNAKVAIGQRALLTLVPTQLNP